MRAEKKIDSPTDKQTECKGSTDSWWEIMLMLLYIFFKTHKSESNNDNKI